MRLTIWDLIRKQQKYLPNQFTCKYDYENSGTALAFDHLENYYDYFIPRHSNIEVKNHKHVEDLHLDQEFKLCGVQGAVVQDGKVKIRCDIADKIKENAVADSLRDIFLLCDVNKMLTDSCFGTGSSKTLTEVCKKKRQKKQLGLPPQN